MSAFLLPDDNRTRSFPQAISLQLPAHPARTADIRGGAADADRADVRIQAALDYLSRLGGGNNSLSQLPVHRAGLINIVFVMMHNRTHVLKV